MSKARIIHELHDDFGVTISEAKKAYDIAVEYIRLRSAIGDHPEDYEPSEYVLVEASAQPEIIRCRDCAHADKYHHCLLVWWWTGPEDFCSRAERRQDETD